TPDLLLRHFTCLTLRANPGIEQSFGGIDVAYAHDQPLIEQGSLYSCFLVLEFLREENRRQPAIERFRTEVMDQLMIFQIFCRHQIARTETAWIIKINMGTVTEMKDQMVMLAGLNLVFQNDHAPGHAKMHE